LTPCRTCCTFCDMMTTIFTTVGWVVMSGGSLLPVIPFPDEAHCVSFLKAQGMESRAECKQVWARYDGNGEAQLGGPPRSDMPQWGR
jgi:hypothetical protein